jgi:BirA family biotin operon repressor/biotin-[acetyl-CoA-carboxylase] ligase
VTRDAGSSAAAAIALPPGWSLVAFDSLGSTNATARELAEDGAGAGTVVWARRQHAGRGRWRRHWDSPEGNLYCSTVLRPAVPAAAAGQLTFVAALALADALAALAPGLATGLKWPNDVLADGRKISGILLESNVTPDGGLPWVVVGVGLNLVSHPDGTPFPATDLLAQTGRAVTPEAALAAYAAALDGWLARWVRDGFPPVRRAWLDRAVGLGGPVTVRLEPDDVAGRFLGLDGEGALELETAAGERRLITAGDVFFGGGHASGH